MTTTCKRVLDRWIRASVLKAYVHKLLNLALLDAVVELTLLGLCKSGSEDVDSAISPRANSAGCSKVILPVHCGWLGAADDSVT